MKSTQPVAMALSGILPYSALPSCAKVMPPWVLIALMPSVPSEPAPVSTTPSGWTVRSTASDSKKRSIGR